MIRIEKLNKSYAVFADNGKELGSFQLDSDGSYYFFENSKLTGYWAANQLRSIADKLDEVNREFDEELDKYFDSLRIDIEEKAKKEYLELLNSGFLFEFYPHLTGHWVTDESEWFDEYKKLIELRTSKDIF
jgi:hypothetical protein